MVEEGKCGIEQLRSVSREKRRSMVVVCGKELVMPGSINSWATHFLPFPGLGQRRRVQVVVSLLRVDWTLGHH